MIETFFYAFHAIAPIVVLLLLGYYIGQKNCFDRHTLKQLSTFSFRFTMCALMFRNVYELPSIHSLEPNVTILVITSLIFITLAGFILAFSITKQRNRYGVIIQASFRSNYAVLGMVLAENLCGVTGVSAAVGLQASGIFYYNIAAVFCLTMFSDQIETQINMRKIVRQLVTNPMLIGIFAGFCCLITRESIPEIPLVNLYFLSRDLDFIYSCIENLANMTTPLVLLR
ncbi:MAG: AEC family transporter [Eubacteriales bacterium]